MDSKTPQILINDSALLPKPSENLTPSPVKKPGHAHIKRFSVNLRPSMGFQKPSPARTTRKSSLEMQFPESHPSNEKDGHKPNQIKEKREPFEEKKSRQETIIRKKAINNSEEDAERTERRLLMRQFFAATGKQPDFVVERNKIAKNWLKNVALDKYTGYLLNAFHLNTIKTEEFISLKQQNHTQAASLKAEIQGIISQTLPLDGQRREIRVPKIMLINQKYNANGCNGILLMKPGAKLALTVKRRVFFASPANIHLSEPEKRYSFLQIKDKSGSNINKMTVFKQYPLPESVLIEKRGGKRNWKGGCDYRIAVYVPKTPKPLLLYPESEDSLHEIFDYLRFKLLLRGIPQPQSFFHKLSVCFYSEIAGNIAKSMGELLKSLAGRGKDGQEGEEDEDSSDLSSDTSKPEAVPIQQFPSSSSLTKTRTKDLSLTRKTQQLFLVMKCTQEDYIKALVGFWLVRARELQKEYFQKHKEFNRLEPREILPFEGRKRRAKQLEAIAKEGQFMGVDKAVIRRFIGGWLDLAIAAYKLKGKGKIKRNEEKRVFLRAKTLEIPVKLDYFKPKIRLKLIRNVVDKPKYLNIDRKRVIVEKPEYFSRVLETNLTERRPGGVFFYEVQDPGVEISGFEAQDLVAVELYDDSGLSVYEKKQQGGLGVSNGPASMDISLFLSNSRLITHRVQLNMQELASKRDVGRIWVALDYEGMEAGDSGENNLETGEKEPAARVISEGFSISLSLEIEETGDIEKGVWNGAFDAVFGGQKRWLAGCFDPKALKRARLQAVLEARLSLSSQLSLKQHQPDPEARLTRFAGLFFETMNELICKAHVNSIQRSSELLLSALSFLSDPGSIKTRAFFLHELSQKVIKTPILAVQLASLGVNPAVRRLLWGSSQRENLLAETIARVSEFRSRNKQVQALPSPLIEETVYILLLEDQSLRTGCQEEYLCFLSDVSHELNSPTAPKDLIRTNKLNCGLERLIRAFFCWNRLNNHLVSLNGPVLTVLARILRVFEAGYPYYPCKEFDNKLFKRIAPGNYLESDVFWCFLALLTQVFPRYFTLEGTRDPLEPANHYCHSDLRGVKGDLLVFRLYLKERGVETIDSGCLEAENWLAEVLLTLGSEAFWLRIDVWARFIDKLLVFPDKSEAYLAVMSLILALILKCQGKTYKIRCFEDLKLLLTVEAGLIEDIEGFLVVQEEESRLLADFQRKNKGKIEDFEEKVLLGRYFCPYNLYNRVIFSYIERLRPFGGISAPEATKLSLADLSQVLSIEDLLQKRSQTASVYRLHVFVYNLGLFYVGGLFTDSLILRFQLSTACRELEIPLESQVELNIGRYLCLELANLGEKLVISVNSKGETTVGLKSEGIWLAGLRPNVLYKAIYRLGATQADYNYLSSQITVGMVLEGTAFQALREEKTTFSADEAISLATNHWFFEKNDVFNQNNIVEKPFFQSLLEKTSQKLSFESENDETSRILAKESASKSLPSGLFEAGVDELEFLKIARKLVPSGLESDHVQLFQELNKLLPGQQGNLDLCSLFISLLVMSHGPIEAKMELFYRLLVVVNRGASEIALSSFKGFVSLVYMFMGYRVSSSRLSDVIDAVFFGNREQSGVVHAEIRLKSTENKFISLDISEVLNDFARKKGELTGSKDLILGGESDLEGLRDILGFYAAKNEANSPEIKQFLTVLSLPGVEPAELMLKYTSPQGLRHSICLKFTANWKIIAKTPSKLPFLPVFSQADSRYQHSFLGQQLFLGHRNVLVLTAPATTFLEKKELLRVFDQLPLFKYLLSLQGLHRVFTSLPEPGFISLPALNCFPVSVRLPNGVVFNVRAELDTRMPQERRLNGLKMKGSAMKLADKALLYEPGGVENLENQLNVKKISLFSRIEDNMTRILQKVLKVMAQRPPVAGDLGHYARLFPVVRIGEQLALDIENLSFFTVFWLNKRAKKIDFEASFLIRMGYAEDVAIRRSKIEVLGLFRHCDQSSEWLPAAVLHSFKPKNMKKGETGMKKEKNDEKKGNYEYFSLIFHKFPLEIMLKRPSEVIFLRKPDLINMQLPDQISSLLPKTVKAIKPVHEMMEEKPGESIFKEPQSLIEDLIVDRKLTIDERKQRVERKGKRILSQIPKKPANN